MGVYVWASKQTIEPGEYLVLGKYLNNKLQHLVTSLELLIGNILVSLEHYIIHYIVYTVQCTLYSV